MSNPTTPYGTPGSFAGVDIAVGWEDIRFRVPDKEILKGISGQARPRRALAIMGSSGAGKTTFLNAIADRLHSEGPVQLTGSRFLNNVAYERKHRRVVGFVPQDDILNPMSTPTEAMKFSLRIRRGVSHDTADDAVEKMLDELNLVGARDTIVGIPGIIAGLSGGERKRTNIGVELICDPKVLMLDEPTSGLDSVTAAKVCSLLKELSRRGRTVIYTIHQPTADCVAEFDDLMLMVAGSIVYHGTYESAVDYFESVGFPCPDTYTPTDYFMTLMQDEAIGARLVELWAGRTKPEYDPFALDVRPENTSFTERYLTAYDDRASASLAIEFSELMGRSWKSVTRNKMFIGATFMQNIVFGLIAALIFAKLEDNVTGISDRIGLLFMLAANTAFSSVMGMINNFPPEKAVFIRDQQGGAYSPLLYFLSKQMAELPTYVVATFLQAAIVYWITGLVPTAGGFFTFYGILMMMQQVGAGFGLAISAAIDSYVIASGTTPLILIPMMLVAGIFASTARLRPYWYWLEKSSFMRAGYVLLAKNEFQDLDHIRCDAAKFGQAFCSRQPKTGWEVLDAYELTDGHGEVWVQWVILAGIFVLSRIIGVAFLYKIAKTKN